MSDDRPAAGWGLIGHQRVVGLLRRAITDHRVSHAYLLTGARQCGKTTLALAFARALNCEQQPDPCGLCRSCRAIAKGVHPDVRLLQLGDGRSATKGSARKQANGATRGRTKTISMDDIRAMLRDVVLAPYEGRWKVYIISYAEDLSLEAIQTLLKTLEEPPRQVVLTLTTADAKILPLTVVSRCQQVALAAVPAATIAEALRQRNGVPADHADLLAKVCEGRVGWAIEAASDPGVMQARAERLSVLVGSLQAGRFERLAQAEQLAAEFAREPDSTFAALELWLSWWRDLMLTKQGISQRVVNLDRERELQEQAAAFRLTDLIGAMKSIRGTLVHLQQNVNPRLALEVLMLSLPAGGEVAYA